MLASKVENSSGAAPDPTGIWKDQNCHLLFAVLVGIRNRHGRKRAGTSPESISRPGNWLISHIKTSCWKATYESMMKCAMCVCVCVCVCVWEDLADLFTIRVMVTGRQLCVQSVAQKGSWASDRFGNHYTLVEVGAFFFFQVTFILQLPNSLISILEIYILLNCAEIQ